MAVLKLLPLSLSLLIVVGLCSLHEASADSRIRQPVMIPDSPAGNRLNSWLEAHNDGRAEQLRRYLVASLSPSKLEEKPLEERLLFFEDFARDVGRLIPYSVERNEAHVITVLMQSEVGEDGYTLTFNVEPDPPHYVSSIAIGSDAPSPDTKTSQRIPLSTKEFETAAATYMDHLSKFGYHGAILISKDGEVILNNSYGQAQPENGIDNTTLTLFSTGSVTKQFTATAILHLEMNDYLTTSDPITRYFKDVPEDKRDITIHHLLTHSAGLRPSFGMDEDSVTRDEFVQLVLSSPLIHPVGATYEYSNAGYSVLAAIIEIVSSKEYETFLCEEFFDPLDMSSTGLKRISVDPRLVAHSHNEMTNYASPMDRPDDYWHLKGNGGILSTTMDMHRWLTALQSNSVLSAAAKSKMFTPYVREYEEDNSYYGYGWVIEEVAPGDTVIWHNGGAMPHGWGCSVYHFVQHEAIFIEFSNKTIDGRHPGDDIVHNLAMIMVGEDVHIPPAVQPDTGRYLGNLEGEYSIDGGGILRVRSEAGKLLIAPEGQNAVNCLFPSPHAALVSRYNPKTVRLIEALASDDYDAAVSHFSYEGPSLEEWRRSLGEWWESLDSLGEFRSIDMIGTKVANGAHTYCRINFDAGSILVRFFWMGGKCEGLSPRTDPLEKEFLPTSPRTVAGYSLATGRVVEIDFSGNDTLVLTGERQRVTARKQ